MSKLEYKPIEMQDECFGRFKEEGKTTVLVRYEAQGKIRKHYRNEAIDFHSVEELESFIKKNKIRVLPAEKFKANPRDEIMHLITAI